MHGLSDRFRNMQRPFGRGGGQDHDELFSSVPGHEVPRTNRTAMNGLRDGLQAGVSRLMSIQIVVILE